VQAKQKQQETILSSLSNVYHIVVVLSGKGGVGKSTIACQIAFTLSHQGYNVGLLDVDICGPSVPRMVGVVGREVHKSGSGWSPVYATPTLSVMSIAFLLQESDSAIVWRGPRKNGMIEQFLTETDWSSSEDDRIDYLIVDTPPGTSDEHISIVQFLQNFPSTQALVVTTPEEVSMADVRKELNFCKKTELHVLGVVENMTKLQIPFTRLRFYNYDDIAREETDCTADVMDKLQKNCPEVFDLMVSTDVFPRSGEGPRGMAKKFGVPYLGALPLDPNLLKACEDGVCFVEHYDSSPAVEPLQKIVDEILEALPVPEED